MILIVINFKHTLMKVSGFAFIRNTILYDYPITEAISSILPLVDEMVVAVGKSDDNTLEVIRLLAEKSSCPFKIIETIWDENLREGGKVLAEETNKALAHISKDSDWAIYIQGDEVIHEDDLDVIKEAMIKYKDEKIVDGLLFDYLHFYGSYEYIANSSKWYSNEIRVIRPQRNIYSYKDAQGFRKGNNEKLKVKSIAATIHHYGWVKPPQKQQAKQKHFNKLWHSDKNVEKMVGHSDDYNYLKNIDSLEKFKGSHPTIMKERIAKQDWIFHYNFINNKKSFKEKIKNFLYKLTGRRLGEYKNYILLK